MLDVEHHNYSWWSIGGGGSESWDVEKKYDLKSQLAYVSFMEYRSYDGNTSDSETDEVKDNYLETNSTGKNGSIYKLRSVAYNYTGRDHPYQTVRTSDPTASGASPFSLNLHSGDLGHTLILGPTGSGKSTLLATIAAQFQRYKNGQLFFFDNGRSIFPLCEALDNSAFYDLGRAEGEINLCPLAEIDDPDVMLWASEWIEMLVELVSPGLVTPQRRILLNEALQNLAASTTKPEERTLTEYITSIQDREMKAALGYYSLSQSGGYILDGDRNDISYASFNAFEISGLLERDKIAPAVMTYLFFQIQRRLKGAPSLLVVDEAWTALRDPLFADKIRGWLKTFRKLNCAVILATQSIADVVNSTIRDPVFESCPTKILLANPDARGEQLGAFYREFLQLNERQINLLAHMVRKREYYILSPDGRRVFNLGLGPVALAFVGASSGEELSTVESLKATYGRVWPAEWLKIRGLPDWAEEWLRLDEEMHPEDGEKVAS